MGQSVARYESRAKVTGQPLYAADEPLGTQAYAFLLTSAVAKGRIAKIDSAAARAVPGVIEIFTHENAPKRAPVKHVFMGGYVSDTFVPLSTAEIRHDGQIVAMVVADSFEAAREAAYRIDVDYRETEPSATFDRPGVETVPVAKVNPTHKDKTAGDFVAGWAAAAVKVDQRYATPTQHHNPIELFSTTAAWTGDEVTIYEPTQFIYSTQHCVAQMLGIEPAKVRVVNPYVGGAFGSKGLTQRSALVASVARAIGRPVKLVVTRDQGFTCATYRAETRHHVRLGAGRDGRLVAYGHEGWEVTSRYDDYSVNGTENTVEMYACPNIWSRVNLVHTDRNTPGFMRSPPEIPYMYALESAIDELAVALAMDPVELRRVNDTTKSPISGAPWTSRSLMKCYDEAAASFGWAKRTPAPMSMRDGDWLIGYGCATATYPTNMMAATARIRLGVDGKALVQVAAHDVGTGAYTAMQQIAAERLRLPLSSVSVEMGDSRLPPGPVSGGSMTTASAGSAVHLACAKISDRFGGTMPGPKELAAAFKRIGAGSVEEYAEYAPPGGGAAAVQGLYRGMMGGGEEGEQQEGGAGAKPMMYAMGANFVEVRVHRLTREIRVPRMTGAFAGGRIVNPRTARSQYLGGMIWGMSSALLEFTEIDEKRARYVNDNIAEYLVAVNADIPQVDIILVPEVDAKVNPLGVKGIGELANVGMAAAIANAVHHATGVRVRDLPITVDKLIAPARA